nr:MAG TPA: hypothetical protein [Caudoviricetes sp.]
MLNHILGILIGYMLAGYVCVYIDARLVLMRISRKKLKIEQEQQLMTDSIETERKNIQQKAIEEHDQVWSDVSVNTFLVFAICWPLLIRGVHEQIVATMEDIYDTTLD